MAEGNAMRSFAAITERDRQTGLYVGSVPEVPGAHSQGATIDELRDHLAEVLQLVLDEGVPELEVEFVGTQQIVLS
jgi:predicted RNase H-like HicB family nuclease